MQLNAPTATEADPNYYLGGYADEPHPTLRAARLEAGRKQQTGARRSFQIYRGGQLVGFKAY